VPIYERLRFGVFEFEIIKPDPDQQEEKLWEDCLEINVVDYDKDDSTREVISKAEARELAAWITEHLPE
jgi:hypothetical protein